MSNKKLSVIIVNYRSEQHLAECIDSIRNISNNPEIIVVNNDNIDLAPVLSDIYNLKIIEGKNKGFGSGANLGFTQAGGDIILFLNPDARILSPNIETVLSEFQGNPKLDVLGPCLVHPAGLPQPWSAGKETGIFDIIRNNLKFPRSRAIWENRKKTAADWVSGTAMFIRREAFNKVGGFDEKFFMYFEDMDLCRRIRLAGGQVMFFPEFKIKHFGGESYGESRAQKKDYYNSMERYFQKHRPIFEWKLIRMIRKLFF